MNRKIVLLGALTLCITTVSLASDLSSPQKKKTRRPVIVQNNFNNHTADGYESGYEADDKSTDEE